MVTCVDFGGDLRVFIIIIGCRVAMRLCDIVLEFMGCGIYVYVICIYTC